MVGTTDLISVKLPEAIFDITRRVSACEQSQHRRKGGDVEKMLPCALAFSPPTREHAGHGRPLVLTS